MRNAQIRGRNLLRPEKLTDALALAGGAGCAAVMAATAERLGGLIYVSRLARHSSAPERIRMRQIGEAKDNDGD